MCIRDRDAPNNEVLEELFQMFNLSRPQDFEGHSLSLIHIYIRKYIDMVLNKQQLSTPGGSPPLNRYGRPPNVS